MIFLDLYSWAWTLIHTFYLVFTDENSKLNFQLKHFTLYPISDSCYSPCRVWLILQIITLNLDYFERPDSLITENKVLLFNGEWAGVPSSNDLQSLFNKILETIKLLLSIWSNDRWPSTCDFVMLVWDVYI